MRLYFLIIFKCLAIINGEKIKIKFPLKGGEKNVRS